MPRVLSGSFHGHKGDPEWRLLTGSGHRKFQRYIRFPQPFSSTPNVIASLSGLDILDGQNHRLTVTVEDVDRNGFNLSFNTWADTRVWAAWATWIAHGD